MKTKNNISYKKILGLILAFALVVGSLPVVGLSVFASSNGIVNGDFETNTTNGFLSENTTLFQVVQEPDNASNLVLQVSGSSATGKGWFYQDVDVKQNTDYAWSFRMKEAANSTADYPSHIVSVLGGSSFDTTLINNVICSSGATFTEHSTAEFKGWTVAANKNDWVTITVYFNSGSNTAVRLRDNAFYKNRNTYIDDWRLDEVIVGKVLNGNFENGFGGFSTDKNTTVFKIVEENGNKVLNVSGGAAGKGIVYQDIPVEPNTEYIWSYKMKEKSGSNKAHYVAVLGGSDYTTVLDTGIVSEKGTNLGDRNATYGWASKNGTADEWDTFYVTFNSGNNTSVRLNYNVYYSERNTFLDDWSVFKKQAGEVLNGDFEIGTAFFKTDATTKFKVVNDNDNNVLNVSGGSSVGSGMFWQDVPVKANTDYKWTFRIKDVGTTTYPSHIVSVLGGDSFDSSLVYNAVSSTGNWLEKHATESYKGWSVMPTNSWMTITVYFNSGSNTVVRLRDNAFYNNRDAYIDDWKLSEINAGTIENGGFDNETTGFMTDGKTNKFVVVDEDESKVLNVSGSTTSGNGKFMQFVSVKKNTDYVLTFRFKDKSKEWAANFISISGSDSAELVTKVTDSFGCTDLGYNTNGKGYTIKIATANTWSTFNVYFNSGNNKVLRVSDNLYASNRNAYFDDFKLYEVSVDNIINSDFEDGLAGFTTDGKTTAFKVQSIEGNNALLISGSSNSNDYGGSFWQDVPVRANTNYKWTFKMKDAKGQSAAHIISVLGGSSFDTSLISNVVSSAGDPLSAAGTQGWYAKPHDETNWVTITVYFNSGSNTVVRLRDNAYTSGRNTYIDDWKLSEVVAGEIINGDFEDGLVGFETDNLGQIKTENLNGNNALYMKGSNYGNGKIWQDVPVKTNTNYKWTFKMKDSNGQGAAHIVSVLGGSSFNTSLISKVVSSAGYDLTEAGADYKGWYAKPHDGTNWVTITVYFNSGTNNVVRLRDNAYAADKRNTYIDDWKLTEVIFGDVTNGDFENDLNDFYADGFGVVETVNDGNSNVLHMVGENYGKGSIWHYVDVEKNTEYVWTFKMKETTRVTNAHIVAVLGGSSYNQSLISNVSVTGVNDLTAAVGNANLSYDGWFVKVSEVDNWETVTVRFNSGNNTVVRLVDNAYANTRNTYLDDWKVNEVIIGDIVNGSFDNGTTGFGTSATTKFEVINQDGNNVLNISGGNTAGTGTFWQDVPVEKDTYYLWTFRLSDTDVNKNHSVAVYPGFSTNDALAIEVSSEKGISLIVDSNNIAVNIRSDRSWDTFTVRFYSGDNTNVRLWHNANYYTRDAYIDDWSLTVDENRTPIRQTYIVVKGDINDDTTVDIRDLLRIEKYLNNDSTEVNLLNSELNSDDIINSQDRALLRKSLIGVGEYSLVWSEEFDGELSKNWSFGNEMKPQTDLELREDSTVANVNDGKLTLTAGRIDSNNYYTAKALSTADSMAFKYGYIEMKAKIPVGSGAFPSFWLLSSDLARPKDAIGTSEIDIFEVMSSSNSLKSNIHKWYFDGTHHELASDDKTAYSLINYNSKEYHTFGLKWTPEILEFSVDGEVYMTVDISDTNNLTGEFKEQLDKFVHDPHYVILSNYVYTKGFANDDKAANENTAFPKDYVVEYVKLYQLPGEGNLVLHK